MKEWKEEMEEEKREKEMEALRHKHMMVQKMANITEQFQHQKLKLVHDVTSQFLEFCKFFTETFGQMSRDDDWSMGVKDVWGEDDDRWGNDMKDMGGRMNSSMGNSTTPGNGTRGNNSTGGNMGGDSTEDYEQWAERQKMEMKAQKFYRMNQKERSMELFHGMVKALCQRAGEYVDHVKKFESFYVKYVADWERSHN
nr:hypothetical protein BaRGS_015106 [Batillaria attramentaria]